MNDQKQNKWKALAIIFIILILVIIVFYVVKPIKTNEEKNCVEDGGLISYLQEGQNFGLDCCEGLVKRAQKDRYQSDCNVLPGGVFSDLCLNCGDDYCNTEYESKCNCPEDCEENSQGGPTQYGECGDGVCDYGENTPSYPYYCPQDCE